MFGRAFSVTTLEPFGRTITGSVSTARTLPNDPPTDRSAAPSDHEHARGRSDGPDR